MDFLFALVVFILGTIVGSFLNVVLLRFKKRSWFVGRSQCPSCERVLAAVDLIPVLSYIGLRGKCRTCNASLSLQYPFVELLTGFLFLGVYVSFAPISGLAEVLLFSMLIAVMCFFVLIVVFDFRYTIIPNEFVFPLIAISFLIFLLQSLQGTFFSMETLLHFLAGPLLYLPFYFLWRVSQGRWIGLGDAKLALAIGWLLGLSDGFSAIVLAFWVGAVVMLGIIAIQYLRGKGKKIGMKTEVPFGPFLIAGTLLVLFYELNVLQVSDQVIIFFIR